MKALAAVLVVGSFSLGVLFLLLAFGDAVAQRGYQTVQKHIIDWRARYAREQMRRIDRETFVRIQRAARER